MVSGPGGGGCWWVGQSPSGVAAGGMPRAVRASCLAAAPLGLLLRHHSGSSPLKASRMNARARSAGSASVCMSGTA